MGVGYAVYVLPEVGSMGFQPDGVTLASIIRALIDNQWAQRAETYSVITGNDAGGWHAAEVRGDTLAEDLKDLVSRERGFVLALPPVPDDILWPSGSQRSDGKSRQYDFGEDETGLFRACYSDTVDLIWSPALFAVPTDAYNDTPVPCPGCGVDVLVEFQGRQPATRGLYYAGVRHTVPSKCSGCGGRLTPEVLSARMWGGTSGMATLELAPFAHFMLALHPSPGASPVIYPHPIDKGLLEALGHAASVAFRHVGRWK